MYFGTLGDPQPECKRRRVTRDRASAPDVAATPAFVFDVQQEARDCDVRSLPISEEYLDELFADKPGYVIVPPRAPGARALKDQTGMMRIVLLQRANGSWSWKETEGQITGLVHTLGLDIEKIQLFKKRIKGLLYPGNNEEEEDTLALGVDGPAPSLLATILAVAFLHVHFNSAEERQQWVFVEKKAKKWIDQSLGQRSGGINSSSCIVNAVAFLNSLVI